MVKKCTLRISFIHLFVAVVFPLIQINKCDPSLLLSSQSSSRRKVLSTVRVIQLTIFTITENQIIFISTVTHNLRLSHSSINLFIVVPKSRSSSTEPSSVKRAVGPLHYKGFEDHMQGTRSKVRVLSVTVSCQDNRW